jgi:hypothetical protein
MTGASSATSDEDTSICDDVLVIDFLTDRECRDTVIALRNEAHSADALNFADRAARLRAHADRLERKLLAIRRPSPRLGR